MFGLCVRFTCKDEAAAEAYDRLVAETIGAIKTDEPGTLVYASHLVEGQPLQRIFYELYRDKAAFEAHEAAPHTRRYLDERSQYLASTEVDWLTLQAGKGTVVTTPDYQKALGRKIAAERRRRGLTQPELARMVDRSVAWVSQVERGVRKVDRMSVLEALAAALEVPLAELAAEAPVVVAVTEESPGAGGMRLILSGAYALRAMLDGRRAPATGILRTKTRKAWELTHAGRYTDLTDLLRGLVPDLETATRSVPEKQRAEACELLATTYQACSAALAKLGEPEAAWIAADRAMAAAERAGNPMLVAAGAFRLVFVFINARHYDQAEETARTAAEALWPMADHGNPQAMSLWGGLTLQRAVIAAHLNDPDTAYGQLQHASQIAIRLGEGHNEYNTEFGPANVRLYEIAVAVELGDAGRALHAAATVDASGLSAERQARMLIDVARAHAQRRQVNEAVAALLQAETITPEQVRGHALVRQLVSDLLTMQDPPASELRDLAKRLTAKAD